jgi:hypothetical protein
MSFQPGSYSRKQIDLRSGSRIVASMQAFSQFSILALRPTQGSSLYDRSEMKDYASSLE